MKTYPAVIMSGVAVMWLITVAPARTGGLPRVIQTACERDVAALKASVSSLLPWDADLPGNWWEERAKYYVISAVDSVRGAAGSELKFAANDAGLLSQQLCRLGFAPANDLGHAVLTGDKATADNVVRAAKALSEVTGERDPVLVYYYSGHGLMAGDKLSLQFWDQDDVSTTDGTSLAEVLSRIRAALPEFQLLVIIDACFSGAAIGLPGVDPSLLDGVTLLLSSSKSEFSKPVTRPGGAEVSAFTSLLLDVLEREDDWYSADSDMDGLLWAEDVFHFAEAGFKRLAAVEPDAFQTPKYSAFGRPQLFAYDRTRLQNPRSAKRGSFVRLTVRAPRATDGAIVFGKERVSPLDVRVTVSTKGRLVASVPLSSFREGSSGFEGVVQLPSFEPLSGPVSYKVIAGDRTLAGGLLNLAVADSVLFVDDKNQGVLTSHEGRPQGGGGLGRGTKVVLDKVKQF